MAMSLKGPALSRHRAVLFRLLALAFALLFAAGLGEAALRMLGYGRSYVHAFSMFYEVDSLVGVRGRPNFTGRLVNNEMDAIISNDEQGFRKPAREVPATSDRRNVFVLGDSFLWGWGVGQGSVMTDLMQERLASCRVKNLAVAATGTVQQFVIFEKFALPELRRGDWVVLGFCGLNDFADNLGYNLPGRLYATVVNGEIRLVPPDGTACPSPTLQRLRDASDLVNLLIYSWNRGRAAWRGEGNSQFLENAAVAGASGSSGASPRATTVKPADHVPDQEPYGEKSAEVIVARHFLRAIKTACEERGARFMIVYIPRQEEFGELVEYKGNSFSSRDRQTLLLCARSLGIPLVDLLPRFRDLKARAPGERLTYFEGHWNAAGHRVASDAVCEFVTAQTAAR